MAKTYSPSPPGLVVILIIFASSYINHNQNLTSLLHNLQVYGFIFPSSSTTSTRRTLKSNENVPNNRFLVLNKDYTTKQSSIYQSDISSLCSKAVDQEDENHNDEKSEQTPTSSIQNKASSKREMLTFAIPTLGIFLINPLMSNIDNMFVGRTAGTTGLAALSPATICTDQMLYLFVFLSRATTGIVSRAYGSTKKNTNQVSPTTSGNTSSHKNDVHHHSGNIEAARDAASAPFTIAIICGLILSIFYAFHTPTLLHLLKVDPTLLSSSASYVYWRGSIAWAALAQSVSLSIMLATRDAISPLKIVSLAAIVNIIGDALLCVYPLRLGCAGAAAATAFATLFSSTFMIKKLRQKQLLPSIRLPRTKPASISSSPITESLDDQNNVSELKTILEYMGPILAITITRLSGFISMQRAAMRLGVQPLAAFQICINALLFFILFGEPLSQLSQTQLPSLLDDAINNIDNHNIDNDSNPATDEKCVLVWETCKSILTISFFAAFLVGGVALCSLLFGSVWFSTDPSVQAITKVTAPSVFIAIVQAILSTTIDGAMLASRDFSFIFRVGLVSSIVQMFLTSRARTLSAIFASFTFRLMVYAFAAMTRISLGYGNLGKVLQWMRFKKVKSTKNA